MSDLIQFLQRAVQTRSYSDQEGDMAHLLVEEMKKLGFDQAEIDATGNVVGRMGSGPKIIHFDGHMDTVQVNDGPEWAAAPLLRPDRGRPAVGPGQRGHEGAACAPPSMPPPTPGTGDCWRARPSMSPGQCARNTATG